MKKSMNCLAYRYQYRLKFYNWLPVFLEKVKITSTNKNFIICCWYFSCYLFEILVKYLSTYRVWFNIFVFRCMGLQGCYCVLNPKSTRGVVKFLFWCIINLSATCMHIFTIIFGCMVGSLNQRVHWR